MQFFVESYPYDMIFRTSFPTTIHLLPYMVTKVTIYGNLVESNRAIPNRLISNAVFDKESNGTIFRYRSHFHFSINLSRKRTHMPYPARGAPR